MRSPVPSPRRLWLEDSLLRRPSSPLPSGLGSVVLALRQPQSVSPIPAWELLRWLGDGSPPLLLPGGGRWLEFHRPLGSVPGLVLLLALLVRWIPRLVRRDLPPRLVLGPGGGTLVLRDWGELALPLVRDYFGLRLALRISLAGIDPLLLSLFRLRP